MTRGSVFFQGLISFLIVAFGQPSFAPWLAPIAGAMGYALFWKAIRIFPFASQRFWRAGLWYGAVTVIQISWMSSIEFQGVYILFVWLALSVWMGLQFAFLSILIPYNKPMAYPRILAIAALWTLLEWSRHSVWCGYSWNLSGLALANPLSIQFAALFGALGLTFYVIFVNLVGVRALLKKRIPYYLTWFGFACIPYLFGLGHIAFHEKQMQSSPNLSCLLVQTGMLPSEKTPLKGKVRAFVNCYDQWDRILGFIAKEGEQNVDLIVLPEAVVPLQNDQCLYDRSRVEALFARHFPERESAFPVANYPFVAETGGVSNAFFAQTLSNLFASHVVIGLDHVDAEGKSYNSAFCHCPNDGEVLRYDKRRLMPLAEYLPYRWLMPLVSSYGIADFFTPGVEAKVFDGPVQMGVSICYEETFPHLVRQGSLKGAELFVNVTNDGWYPFSSLPEQHYHHARLRAVENGSAVLRACNSGVTAAIDSLGRPLGKMAECEGKTRLNSGALFASVPIYNFTTPFFVWGNGGILTLSILCLGFFLLFKKQFKW